MLTINEKKVLRMLFAAFEDYSINQVARRCGLAPNGALKMLKKFEKGGILKANKVANIKSYSLNFENEKTKSILELVLIPELKGRLKFRLEDLGQLKNTTDACILFGSYADLKKEPNDMDILVMLNKKNFKAYKEQSTAVFKTIPIKVHDILQTEEDFKENLRKKDKTIIEILKTGIILWGYKKIIDLIENEHQRQA